MSAEVATPIARSGRRGPQGESVRRKVSTSDIHAQEQAYLQEDIAKARREQLRKLEIIRKRKTAHGIQVGLGDTAVDAGKEKLMRFCPEAFWRDADGKIVPPPRRDKPVPSGYKPPDVVARYKDRRDWDQEIARGWEPIVDDHKEVAQDENDPAMKIPYEIWLAERKAVGKESSDRLPFHTEKDLANTEALSADMASAMSDSTMQKQWEKAKGDEEAAFPIESKGG